MTPTQRGVDTSGRALQESPVMWSWWDAYVTTLGFTPTITQGGWMGEAAADLSGPTHDADALDLRVWDRSRGQVEVMVRVARSMGAAAWLRDKRTGFDDPHVHLVPGTWAHPSAAAQRQWDACAAGRDGLASNGADYHPYPLAPTWKADPLMAAADDILKRLDDLAAQSAKETADLKRRLDTTRKVLRLALSKGVAALDENDRAILAELDED